MFDHHWLKYNVLPGGFSIYLYDSLVFIRAVSQAFLKVRISTFASLGAEGGPQYELARPLLKYFNDMHAHWGYPDFNSVLLTGGF
jgi:hypothetical protein